MTTKLQLRANQANAQLSTGPKTEEGKRRASLQILSTAATLVAIMRKSTPHPAPTPNPSAAPPSP